MQLNGEITPIDITINYKWEQGNDKKLFCIQKLTSPREWINEVAKIWFESDRNAKIPVNPSIAAILDKVL